MTPRTPFMLLRLAGALLLAMLMMASPAAAQDDDDDNGDEFGSYIHEGTCDALGDTVEELEDLELDHREHGDDDDDDDQRDRDRIWELIGGEDPRPEQLWAEDDDVDMAFDEMTGGEYALVVHADEDEASDVIACGAITGDVDEDGGLLIDLEEVDDSGYEGRAYLMPEDGDDDDETEIFIGVWEVQGAGV